MNRTNIWLPTSYVQIRSEPHVFRINKLCYVHLNPCNQSRTFISALKSNFPYLGSGLVPGVVRIRTKLYILQINKLCNVQLNPCNQSLTYISAFKSNSLYLGSGLVPCVPESLLSTTHLKIRTKLHFLRIYKLSHVYLTPCNQSLTFLSALTTILLYPGAGLSDDDSGPPAHFSEEAVDELLKPDQDDMDVDEEDEKGGDGASTANNDSFYSTTSSPNSNH